MKPNRKIKLFVDAHIFDNEYQGTRTFIKEIYSVLVFKEDLDIYVGACDIENLKEIFPKSAPVTFVQYKHAGSIKRLLFDIPAILKKYKIDYAHFQYITPLFKKSKFIVTIHDVIFNDYRDEFSFFYILSKNMFYGLSAIRSDIITTVSNHSKHSIKKYLKTKDKAISITPNGVNAKFFEPYLKEVSQKYITKKFKVSKFILYVSRFEPRKNQSLLLKSYLDLQLYKKGYYLVLLGHKSIRVPDFDSLMMSIPNDIKQFIFISSEVNDEDLLHFYKAADLFVYPSKAEGFGIPPLEAAALKIPVICSNTSAMNDFSFFGQYHVNPNDTVSFKETLSNILSEAPSKELLKQISDEIKRKYTWEQSAETFYQSILKNYLYNSKTNND